MITEAWRVLIYYDKRRLNAALCIFKKTPEQVLLFFFASGTYIKLTGVWRQIDWCKFRPNSTNLSRVINVF